MLKAGLDMNILKFHSLRAASTCFVLKSNVPFQTILDTAGWTRVNTLRRYQCKPVTAKEGISHAILNVKKDDNKDRESDDD